MFVKKRKRNFFNLIQLLIFKLVTYLNNHRSITPLSKNSYTSYRHQSSFILSLSKTCNREIRFCRSGRRHFNDAAVQRSK